MRRGAPGIGTKIRAPPRPPLCSWRKTDSPYHFQRAAPARLAKEVQHDVRQETYAVADAGLLILIARRLERPVDEHGSSNNVFSRNETPIAAVQAHAAVVAHREVMAGRHYQILAIYVRRQFHRPGRGNIRICRRYRRETVA